MIIVFRSMLRNTFTMPQRTYYAFISPFILCNLVNGQMLYDMFVPILYSTCIYTFNITRKGQL